MATTTIQVLEYDASGAPLAGYITVNLAKPIGDSTNGAVWLPAIATVQLVAGAATLNLLPSTDTNTNYLFSIYQYNPAPATDATLIYSFEAAVPLSNTPVQLRTLLSQVGIVGDATDGSIAAIVRELYYSNTFWTTLAQYIYPNTGTWDSGHIYSYGNLAFYQGNMYSSISVVPQSGNNPLTSPTIWRLFTQQGIPGTGITGDTAAYDATGWNDPVLGLKAPNKQVLRNIIETLARTSQLASYAPLASPNLTTPTIASDPTSTDRSSLIPSTNWVQNLLDVLRKPVVPVGLISPYAGSSAPTYWVLCDGRTLSQTTYSALYSILGSTYNTGGESGGTFRIPDLRGRIPVGLDNMSGVMGAANVISSLTALGTKGGETNHVLTQAELPAHTHSLSPNIPFTSTYSSTASNTNAANASTGFVNNTSYASATGSIGSGSGHNNLQPYNGLNYIIYAGV